LSREEIIATCKTLFFAGYVPTVGLIGNTVFCLLENRLELHSILDGDRNFLIPLAIEETLRYRSPVQAIFRVDVRDVNIGGQTIQSGQRIVLWLRSANHDEFAFEDPERFHILRKSNGQYIHLGFGYGIHYCICAPLASLQTRIVIRIILERLRNLEIADEGSNSKTERRKIELVSSPFLYCISQLPLRFIPAERY
jgi:cytochrome P450